MKKSAITVVGLIAVAGLIGGCATAHKKDDLEAQSLRNQVAALQGDLQARDQEITNLRQALMSRMQEQSSTVTAVSTGESREKPTAKQVQIALKNAGYNPGTIDGKMGRQTREAIKDFQRAKGLRPDGKVGKETWSLLRKYLESKVK